VAVLGNVGDLLRGCDDDDPDTSFGHSFQNIGTGRQGLFDKIFHFQKGLIGDFFRAEKRNAPGI
jgi:hypothetical protein